METNRYLDGLKYIFATTCLPSLRLLRTQGLKFFIIRQEEHSLIKATRGPTLRFYPEQYSSYNCYLEWTQNLIFWQPRADTKPHFNGPREEKNGTLSGQKIFEKCDLERTKIRKMGPKKCRNPSSPPPRGGPLDHTISGCCNEWAKPGSHKSENWRS